jgi:hypothetical protein
MQKAPAAQLLLSRQGLFKNATVHTLFWLKTGDCFAGLHLDLAMMSSRVSQKHERLPCHTQLTNSIF